MEKYERLKQAREAARYSSARSAAAAMGVSADSYAQHENGTRGFKQDTAERYARFFRVDLAWLLTGRGKMTSAHGSLPIVGYVGAGAEIYPIDDHPTGAALDYLDVPASPHSVGVIVRGESMYPFEEGWILAYHRDWIGVPDQCINALCIVKLADDGPMLVKKVRRGSGKNLFNLESWNAPLRQDQKLEWAAPVQNIIPR